MAELVEAVIEDDRWNEIALPERAETACRAALTRLGLDPVRHRIALLGCDDARIRELNARFRGKGTATNVLSWPAATLAPGQQPPAELGDLALAFDTCHREAADQGKDFGDHVTHLLVHGCLHLLGYDHISVGDAARMEGLEVEILAKLGIADPY